MTQDQSGKVVVLGSGITGLVLGALLTEAGRQVTVLEAHPTAIGGHARTLSIGGLEFCAGPRYVWGFGKGEAGQRVLKTLGLEEDVPFHLMDQDAFERFAVGVNPPVDIPMGLDRYAARLCEMFPEESAGLRRFFSVVQEIFEVAQIYTEKTLYLQRPARMTLEIMRARGLPLGLKLKRLRYAYWTLEDLFDDCGLSQPVRRLLYGHSGDFAENESQLSLMLYAAATGFIHQGSYVPANGFDGLLTALRKTIEKNGQVLTGKRVTHLLTDRGQVTHVECDDGSSYPCRTVISTISPRRTAALLPGGLTTRYRYRTSNSMNCFFIGVTGSHRLADDLNLKNLWWQEGSEEANFDRPDTTQPPTFIYLGSHTAHRSSNGTSEAEETLLDIAAATPGNFEQAQAAFRQGPDSYAAYKREVTERMLEAVDRYLYPGFREHVRFVETFTPLDISHELGAENGNTFGRRMDVASFLKGPPSPLPFKNLHLANAEAGLPSIATAFQTAVYWFRKLTGISV